MCDDREEILFLFLVPLLNRFPELIVSVIVPDFLKLLRPTDFFYLDLDFDLEFDLEFLFFDESLLLNVTLFLLLFFLLLLLLDFLELDLFSFDFDFDLEGDLEPILFLFDSLTLFYSYFASFF